MLKSIVSIRTLGLFGSIFILSGGLCVLQLRSLYLKDIDFLQYSLAKKASILDDRLQASLTAVQSIHDQIQLESNHKNDDLSPELPVRNYQRILADNIKSLPYGLRSYYIEPQKVAIFSPNEQAQPHTPSLLSRLFFNLSTPAVNLMRSPYWTRSFMTHAGDGMAVARAMPLYKGEEFKGVVGVDISLHYLMDVLKDDIYRKTQLDSNVFVVGTDRNLLLHSQFRDKPNYQPIEAKTALPPVLQSRLEEILQSPSGKPHSLNGYLVMHYNLRRIPWDMVLWVPETQLWTTVLQNSFWSLIVPWCGLMTMSFAIVVMMQRKALAQKKLRIKSQQLSETLEALKLTQARMIQNEKMSSLSQLVGGIAHEINNPANFIHGNLAPAQEYTKSLLELIEIYEEQFPNATPTIAEFADEIDLDFIKTDLPLMLESMRNGTTRIREIVLLLRNFARMDEAALKTVDLHEGLESTLALMRHRFLQSNHRPEIAIKKLFSPNLPKVECYAGQLNQVFMALIGNAIDAINDCSAEHFVKYPPTLEVVTTQLDDTRVQIQITDNGPGIPQDLRDRIFDPFFTTKPVGQGTGLGLAIAHQVITERHHGQLLCTSQTEEGRSGTVFTLILPLSQVAQFQIQQASQRTITPNVADPAQSNATSKNSAPAIH